MNFAEKVGSTPQKSLVARFINLADVLGFLVFFQRRLKRPSDLVVSTDCFSIVRRYYRLMFRHHTRKHSPTHRLTISWHFQFLFNECMIKGVYCCGVESLSRQGLSPRSYNSSYEGERYLKSSINARFQAVMWDEDLNPVAGKKDEGCNIKLNKH